MRLANQEKRKNVDEYIRACREADTYITASNLLYEVYNKLQETE